MKIKPCKYCGSKDISTFNCGYSTFNPGGATCNKCKYKVESFVDTFAGEDVLIELWNSRQKLTDREKMILKQRGKKNK